MGNERGNYMFTIHVVNSVKGGCGKSTFCLFLENYFIEKSISEKRDIKPIIIDLDLCGSTWYRNNKEFIKNGGNNVKFINDLIDDFNRYVKQEHVFRLKEKILTYDGVSGEERELDFILADPDRAGRIKDEEIDLFENSIYKLIKSLVDCGKTDIIFDMPPGYEEYTERIVKHLLFDLSSPLYKEYIDKTTNKTEYDVKMYMLSCLDGAIISNIKYINDFYTEASYSTATENLKFADIQFIINDVQNAHKNLRESDSDYNNIKKGGANLLSTLYTDIDENSLSKKIHVIEYLELNFIEDIMNEVFSLDKPKKKLLEILKANIMAFDNVLNEIFK